MRSNIAVRLGRNIARARKSVKRTQAEVAELVGIDTVSLSRIERGAVTPSIATLERIANAVGEPLGRLFDGVSSNTDTLAVDVAQMLRPLSADDRLFLLEQIDAWSKKLACRSRR